MGLQLPVMSIDNAESAMTKNPARGRTPVT